MDNIVKYIKLKEDAKVPVYATEGAAGADLRACIDGDMVLSPNERRAVPTGLAISVPEGFAGLIFARSGLALREGLTMANGVGVIDSDYTGELKIAVVNLSDKPYVIQNGDRIAQIVITPYMKGNFVEVESLSKTERACGGFGSTGVK